MARKPLPRAEVGERRRIGATLRALRGSRTLDDVSDRLLTDYRIVASRPFLANIEGGRKRLAPHLADALATLYGVPLAAIVHPDYYSEDVAA
jgi:transcriptional regulator with XRE-family HTH domain